MALETIGMAFVTCAMGWEGSEMLLETLGMGCETIAMDLETIGMGLETNACGSRAPWRPAPRSPSPHRGPVVGGSRHGYGVRPVDDGSEGNPQVEAHTLAPRLVAVVAIPRRLRRR